jgi:hypothetical protein
MANEFYNYPREKTALDGTEWIVGQDSAGGTGSSFKARASRVSSFTGARLGIANVKDYGAVGNGIANDTAAIQAAVDTGLDVYLPAGTYLVTSQGNHPVNNSGTGYCIKTAAAGQKIFGQSMAQTRINIPDNKNGIVVIHDDCVVSDLWVAGGAVDDSTEASSISAAGVGLKRPIIQRCKVTDCDDSGIRFGYKVPDGLTHANVGVVGGRILDCYIENALEGSCIEVIGCQEIIVSRNICINGAVHGIRVSGCIGAVVTDNIVLGGSYSNFNGISLNGGSSTSATNATFPSSNLVCTGNLVVGYQAGIRSEINVDGVTIVGNRLADCLNYGIYFRGWDTADYGVINATVSGNTMNVTAAGGIGIYATTAVNTDGSGGSCKPLESFTITGNTITAYTSRGIYLLGTSGNLITAGKIANNVFSPADPAGGAYGVRAAYAKDVVIDGNVFRHTNGLETWIETTCDNVRRGSGQQLIRVIRSSSVLRPLNNASTNGRVPVTGQTVRVQSSGTLPTGLSANTVYWAWNTGSGWSMCANLADALAGTAIALTGAGSGNHDIIVEGGVDANVVIA